MNEPKWRQIVPKGDQPSPRFGHVSIFDQLNERIIIFGGAHNKFNNEVWALNLKNDDFYWTPIEFEDDSDLPKPRSDHSAIHDTINNRMLIFGGIGRKDLWALNLTPYDEYWELVKPVGPRPKVRSDHSAIYDRSNQQMLVYGGFGKNVVLSLYLNKDSEEWQEVKTDTQPPSRGVHTAVYDRLGRRMLIFGGYVGNLQYRNELWSLNIRDNPASWEMLVPDGVCPSARAGHSAVIDTKHRRILFFGGRDKYSMKNDLWSLALQVGQETWINLKVGGTPPSPRNGHTAVYNPSKGQMIVFGGNTQDQGPTNEIWLLEV